MSTALKIFKGKFGRVSLLDMSKPLVVHAHHHCHVLIKVNGIDSYFSVKGKNQPLTNESVVLVNAWESHAYMHTLDGEGRCILLALYLEPSWLKTILQALTISSHPHFFPKSCAQLSQAARKLADSLAIEMLVNECIDPDILEERIFDLFMSTVEHNSELKNSNALMLGLRSKALDPRIRRAITSMNRGDFSFINVDELARECGLSRAHFFELFKQATNLTPAVYINALRVESVIKGLGVNQASISEISYDAGFSAPGHFTRFFRQHLGITPTEFRRAVAVIENKDDLPSH